MATTVPVLSFPAVTVLDAGTLTGDLRGTRTCAMDQTRLVWVIPDVGQDFMNRVRPLFDDLHVERKESLVEICVRVSAHMKQEYPYRQRIVPEPLDPLRETERIISLRRRDRGFDESDAFDDQWIGFVSLDFQFTPQIENLPNAEFISQLGYTFRRDPRRFAGAVQVTKFDDVVDMGREVRGLSAGVA